MSGLRYNQIAIDSPNGTTRVVGRCVVTDEVHEITVPTAGLNAWIRGELIQRALPTVSNEDREFLLSGTSPEGWRLLFGDEEE